MPALIPNSPNSNSQRDACDETEIADFNDDVNDHEAIAAALDNVNTSVCQQQDSILEISSVLTATVKNGCLLSIMLKIYLFGEQIQLSNSEGNQLLELLKSIYPGATSDQFPSSYETLQGRIDHFFHDTYEIKTSVLYFSSKFSTCALPVYQGHYVNILTLIGDMLLDISVEDLHLEPFLLRDADNNRVIREPASGMDFEMMFNYVQNKFGQDVYPLPITVALDELALNKLGSRGAKPAYVQISSRKVDKYWSSDNLRCVGFSPMTQVSLYTLTVVHCVGLMTVISWSFVSY